MGKIKSARELAMERTANLKDIKDIIEESPGLEYEPYFKASSLLAGSFLEKETALEKVIETINRYPTGARKEAVRIFLEKIIAGIDLDSCEKVAAAYRHYRSDQESGPVGTIEELGRTYREQVRELQAGVEAGKDREQLLERLSRDGISGTALAGVNLERSPWWKEQLSRLAASCSPKLARLKEQLLSSMNKK